MTTDPEYYHANRGGMSKFLPDMHSRVLEVGCGAGGFSDHLKPPCEGSMPFSVERNNRISPGVSDRMRRQVA